MTLQDFNLLDVGDTVLLKNGNTGIITVKKPKQVSIKVTKKVAHVNGCNCWFPYEIDKKL